MCVCVWVSYFSVLTPEAELYLFEDCQRCDIATSLPPLCCVYINNVAKSVARGFCFWSKELSRSTAWVCAEWCRRAALAYLVFL